MEARGNTISDAQVERIIREPKFINKKVDLRELTPSEKAGYLMKNVNHKNRLEGNVVNGPHIHRMTERYQMRTTHPDGFAEATDRYTDLNGAIELFMEMVNLRYSDGKKNRRLEEFF